MVKQVSLKLRNNQAGLANLSWEKKKEEKQKNNNNKFESEWDNSAKKRLSQNINVLAQI